MFSTTSPSDRNPYIIISKMNTKIERDNETWIADLRSSGPAQQAALSELRTALIRSLRGALPKSRSVNDPFLEDTVQDALLLILDRLQQFEGRSRFLTWATSIAVRSAMTELRRKRWKDVSLDEFLAGSLDNNVVLADGHGAPEEDQARFALVSKMLSIIDNELTDRQRTALLAELKGMPQDEIAKHFGSNRNAIYKLTHDARKRLKRGLEAAGYGAADIQLAFAN